MSDQSTLKQFEDLKVGYSTTGSDAVDYFTQVLGASTKDQIVTLLKKAWNDDPLIALKLVFHLRNIRNGKGYQIPFILSMVWIFDEHFETFIKNIQHIPKHGCYKDLLLLLEHLLYQESIADIEFLSGPTIKKNRIGKEVYLANGENVSYSQKRELLPGILKRKRDELLEGEGKKYRIFKDKVVELFLAAVNVDLDNLAKGKPVNGLAAKWLPSPKCHHDKYLDFIPAFTAKMFPYAEKVSEREKLYRKSVLAPLRKASKVTEVLLCSNTLSEIEYSKVPSQCMFRSRKVFQQKDTGRYTEFLEAVKKGEQKINAATVLPHLIIQRHLQKYHLFRGTLEETSLEATWNSLVESLRKSPDLKFSNSLAICDVSGSMSGTPMNVAIALSLIVSTLSNQVWNGILCTFSAKPKLRLIRGDTLGEKVKYISRMHCGMNTNIEAVFDLIFNKSMKESKLGIKENSIDQLFIFSDMRFDECTSTKELKSAHSIAKEKFENAGLTLPKIIYWNLRPTECSPVEKDELGSVILSGFSPRMLQMFLEGKDLTEYTPQKMMLEVLNNPIYSDLEI
jgi:Domain of unknown function (DUF2828)